MMPTASGLGTIAQMLHKLLQPHLYNCLVVSSSGDYLDTLQQKQVSPAATHLKTTGGN